MIQVQFLVALDELIIFIKKRDKNTTQSMSVFERYKHAESAWLPTCFRNASKSSLACLHSLIVVEIFFTTLLKFMLRKCNTST